MVVLNLMIFVQLVIIYPIRLSWWEGPCFVWRGDSQGPDIYFFLYFFFLLRLVIYILADLQISGFIFVMILIAQQFRMYTHTDILGLLFFAI